MVRLIIFVVVVFCGFWIMLVDPEAVKEFIINLCFFGGGILFLIWALGIFKGSLGENEK